MQGLVRVQRGPHGTHGVEQPAWPPTCTQLYIECESVPRKATTIAPSGLLNPTYPCRSQAASKMACMGQRGNQGWGGWRAAQDAADGQATGRMPARRPGILPRSRCALLPCGQGWAAGGQAHPLGSEPRGDAIAAGAAPPGNGGGVAVADGNVAGQRPSRLREGARDGGQAVSARGACTRRTAPRAAKKICWHENRR